MKVHEMLTEIEPRAAQYTTDTKASAERAETKAGTVYVVQAGKFCKIGMSRNMPKRMQQYRVHCPLHVALRYATEAPDPELLEAAAHEALQEEHHHGEWYIVGHRKAASAISAAKLRLWPMNLDNLEERYRAAIGFPKRQRYPTLPTEAER